MSGPRASRRRKGSRHPCTYCGKVHKGGPRGDSCHGHSIKAKKLMEKTKVDKHGPA